MRLTLVLSCLLLSVAGCGRSPEPGPAAPATASAPLPDPGARLSAIYAAFWEEWLALNPLQATQLGDPRFNDQLPNWLAPEYREQLRELQQRQLDAARAVGAAGLEAQELCQLAVRGAR